jgi:hypothetical protein
MMTSHHLLRFIRAFCICFIIFVIIFASRSSSQAAISITGTIFRDYNANGVHDALEPGVPNITLTAYDSTNTVAASTVTAANGDYALAVTLPSAYRVEVTNIPKYLYSGPSGTDSRTTVTFVNAPAANVNIGVSNPGQYCQSATPSIVTNCFLYGRYDNNMAVIVSFPYDVRILKNLPSGFNSSFIRPFVCSVNI